MRPGWLETLFHIAQLDAIAKPASIGKLLPSRMRLVFRTTLFEEKYRIQLSDAR